MSLVTVGIAPDSWGVWFAEDPKQPPWRRFLDEVAQLGFQWIELGPYGYLPTDAGHLQQELTSRKLALSAGMVMLDLEEPDAWSRAAGEVERVCSLIGALGGRFLIIIDDLYTDLFTGEPRGPASLTAASWSRLVNTTTRICEEAQRHGLKGVFHPHAQSHVEFEDQIERLLADAPDLMLCLDVGHHSYCGGDPVEFLRRHHERISYLHLKSVDSEVCQLVRHEGIPFAKAVAEGVFVEPSQGAVSFRDLRNAIDEVGYEGFGIIEQDMYPCPWERPFRIAERTRAYLAALGLV